MLSQVASHAVLPSPRWYEHSGVLDSGRLTALWMDVSRANSSLRRAMGGHGVSGQDRLVLDQAATQLEDVASAIDGWSQLRSSRVWRASTLGTLVKICTDVGTGTRSAADVAQRMRGIATQLRSDIGLLDASTIQTTMDWISRLSAGIDASRSVVPCITIKMGSD